MADHTPAHTHPADPTHPEPDFENGTFDESFWDNLYNQRTAIWSGSPNAVLVQEASELTPGRALDIGCGEGADSLWLAGEGWNVTGVDISDVALGRARAAQQALASQTLAVDWRQEDVLDWTPPAAAFDLVSVHFLQVPPDELELTTRRFAAAVAPKGRLLIVGHSPSDSHASQHPAKHRLFAPEPVVAAAGDGFEVIHAEHRTRTTPDGDERIDTVVVLQRR
jgi:SAM-dependent methyltransferase